MDREKRFAASMRIVVLVLSFCLAAACISCAPPPAPGDPQGVSASSAPSDSESQATSSSSTENAAQTESSASSEYIEDDASFDEMRQEVSAAIEATSMDVGIAFVDVSDPKRNAGFDVRGDKPLVSASMIKLLVLAAFLDEVDAGTLSMEEPYVIQAEDIVGGTGSVQSAGAGASYALGDLAKLMISESDNVAANVLINRLGMDAVNAEAEKLGLKSTELNRLMMDEEAMAGQVENYMSAQDAATLLTLIWRGELVSERASAFALEALKAQSDAAGIAGGLPADIAFAHKTGTLAQVRNDGGIVMAEKPYVLVVFCSGGEQSVSESLMMQLSTIVYDRFE